MHRINWLYWRRCKSLRPKFFRQKRIVEFGSFNINGTVRDFFKNCDYIGVDWRKGPGVDIVSLAHEVKIENCWADVIISASMLEHDNFWGYSIKKMWDVLSEDGVLYLSWGSALNRPHESETAPDGEFHRLKAGLGLMRLREVGFIIEEFFYERNIPGIPYSEFRNYKTILQESLELGVPIESICFGYDKVVLTAVKRKENLIREPYIDNLLSEDRA